MTSDTGWIVEAVARKIDFAAYQNVAALVGEFLVSAATTLREGGRPTADKEMAEI
ncbi:hypothetical protein AA23498_2092 [Acetobacter nitrogenifigens DSM 23921 = NBRC 105050]|uniref:Uncharacterized protein n=1 Tax=Acetobacter nitrogenifigens DSM 23921 = NBRC 105050 TaxID=1120919 RepID=A0A511XF12_9PROT|nr:hypothetical protein [Acetobacter nitrogenifigens]GBQ94705.1 hypothetical protein AA23498_2092 [Acetobacter nitrogenifigens DSM 23921 = NBRC 105050]GEN61539.1 hypothetical protein ANI02nite_34230 [Acetobacter nitrogenifigens DSM 23921 = NBRC 105050]